MERWLAPFNKVMNRLKYGRKFLLIGGLLLIPITVMMTSMIGDWSSQISFAAKERDGVVYNREWKAYLIAVQKHRGLVNSFLTGQTNVQTDIEAAAAGADAALEQVRKADSDYGKELEASAQLQAIAASWEELKAGWKSLKPEDSFKKHSDLVEGVLNATLHIADTSNLTLDPDLDTYYLMEAVTRQLPTAMERMGQARGIGSGILVKQSITEPEKLQSIIYAAEIEQAVSDLNKGLNTGFDYNPELKASLGDLAGQTLQASSAFKQLMDEKLIQGNGTGMESKAFFSEGTKAVDAGAALYDQASSELDRLLKARQDRLAGDRNQLLLMVALILLLVLLFFLSFYHTVKKTVSDLEQAAGRIADGDLTVRVALRTRDELSRVGDAFNRIAEAFGGLIGRNRDMAVQVASSAEELTSIAGGSVEATNQMAEAMQHIAVGSETQVRHTDDQVTAMEEMARGATVVADSSSALAQTSIEAAELAREGQTVMERAMSHMSGISRSVADSSEVVDLLGQRSGEIGEIIGVIGDISDQTHLLALNAAIEAARAGEQGRGFAVVSSEIRKLAESSKTSADAIRGLILEVTALVERAVEAMKASVTETEAGSAAVTEAGRSFEQILGGTERMSRQVTEVSAVSQELSAVSQQVTASAIEMMEIAKKASALTQSALAGSEEQLAGMEEVHASTEALSRIATELQDELEKYKL